MRKIRNFILKMLVGILILALIGAACAFLLSEHVKHVADENLVYTVTGDPEINTASVRELRDFGANCAVVLGCGIEDSETPSPMLKDRLDVGITLYKEGIVPKILLTGDNGQQGHNEIHVMLKYTKAAGIPAEDIFCDHAGFSTYDSMYRAITIFKIDKAIVVTQKYHEYRTLYIGEKLGMDVRGVASDQESYFGQTYREIREILARDKDFFKVLIRSKATYSGDAIPISGSGISSHGE